MKGVRYILENMPSPVGRSRISPDAVWGKNEQGNLNEKEEREYKKRKFKLKG
jgi:hypothetical protein